MRGALREGLEVAHDRGVTVSCDLNYRARMWSPEQAHDEMTRLAPLIDVLFGNEEDAATVFGIRAEGSDVTTGELPVESYQKVAERLGEWVHGSLHIVGPQPNHGWRHRFKSVARDVGMHAEVANFIVGHGGGSVSERYGARWIKTAVKTIAMYPRYRIAALKVKPGPHRRRRRTAAQLAADAAAGAAKKARQANRAA